jgi:hypothetical protein
MPAQLPRSDYPEILRVLGHFVQQHYLSEVSIVEFDGGWIISGLTYQTTPDGFMRVPADYVLSHDEVRKLTDSLHSQRRLEQQTKRGWRG